LPGWAFASAINSFTFCAGKLAFTVSTNGIIATSETGSGPLLAEYADAVPGAYVPDLSASRLTVVHARVAPFSDARRALVSAASAF